VAIWIDAHGEKISHPEAVRRLFEIGLKAKEMKLPNSRERQFMQRLRGAGWVKAVDLPEGPRIIPNLIAKGWVERQQTESGPKYSLTEPGLQAMKALIPIRPSSPRSRSG
jgi:hypothetical protein